MKLKWIKTSEEKPPTNLIVIGKYIKEHKIEIVYLNPWKNLVWWVRVKGPFSTEDIGEPDYWMTIRELYDLKENRKLVIKKSLVNISRFNLIDLD